MKGGRKGGGARQPLSRVRPGAARGAGGGGKVLGAKKGSSAKSARGERVTPGAGSAKGTKGATGVGSIKANRVAKAGKKTKGDGSARNAKAERHPYAPATPDRHPERVPANPPTVFVRLRATFPDAHCALDHRNAFQLLVATILSAQCTDVRVNMVTPALF
jgi:endonuclease-3